MKVQISNTRIAFANIFEPKTVNGEGDPRYSAVFIIDPKSENAKTLAAAVKSVAEEKWGAKAAGILAELVKKGRVCYSQTAKTNANGEVYDGFEDTHSVNASNKARPTVIDRDKTPLTQADGKPYSGCYVNASIELWAQDNQWGRRINATLRGLQFVRDGDAFSGGSPASADEFEDLGVADEAMAA